MEKKINIPWIVFRIMKASFIQLTFGLIFSGISFAHNTRAQEFLNLPITLKVGDAKLRSVLGSIEKQAGVGFVYSSKAIRADRKVSVDAKKKPLSEVLNEILTPLGIKYRIIEGQIILNPAQPEASAGDPSDQVPATDQLTATEIMVDRQITGKVLDEKNDGLPGVSILAKGTQRGTVTDINGNFTLSIPDENTVLVLSFVGYLSKEIEVGSKTQLEVALEIDQKALDEVVVVGYGTLQKKDLTGSVASIGQEQVKDLPVATLDQKMIGQVAGVQIQQVSGSPGGGTSVRIRGSGSLGAGNEPLYVVDGMPYSSGLNQNLNPLMLINPNDIESITVLKDASSTAIYGSRGANGVVMITTKKGQYNKTQVSFSAMRGFQKVPVKADPT